MMWSFLLTVLRFTTAFKLTDAIRPNIVFVLADDVDDYGAMKFMPEFQKWGGIRFHNSFVPYGLCCPSRASILTGVCPETHGVLGNWITDHGGYPYFRPQENYTLPVWLQEAGYDTAFIGKYINGYDGYIPYTPPGWNIRDWHPIRHVFRYYNFSVWESERGLVTYGEYQTRVIQRYVEGFIQTRNNTEKPFFYFVAPFAPHTEEGRQGVHEAFAVPDPIDAGLYANLTMPRRSSYNETNIRDKPSYVQELGYITPEAADMITEKWRRHRETLRGIDRLLVGILRALNESGVLNNTIVIFMGDNGLFRGEHRKTLGKGWMYEEGIRVPLFIRLPNSSPMTVKHVKALVQSIDVTAFIADVTGARPNRPLEGGSFAPMVLYGKRWSEWRKVIKLMSYNGREWGWGYGIRTQNWFYAEAGDEYELYDMQKDPHQLHNLAGRAVYRNHTRLLRRVFESLRGCVGDSCFIGWPNPDVRIAQGRTDWPKTSGPSAKPQKKGVDENLIGFHRWLIDPGTYQLNRDGVMAFQESMGIRVSGELDEETQFKLGLVREEYLGWKSVGEV